MLTKVILLCSLVVGILGQVPSDIPKCKFDDSQCLVSSIQKVFINKFQGSPELGLDSIDPLNIDKMTISQGGDSPVNIVLDFKDAKLTGLNSATFTKVTGFKADPEGNRLEFQLNAPVITVHGPYVGKGRVMIFPVQGNGLSNITLMNPDVSIKFLTKRLEKDGKIYMQIDKFKIDFTVTRLYCNFENLFNGDKILGDNLNLFLNENWSDILNELKPAINAAFGKVFRKIINRVFAKTPYSQLFLP